MRLMNKLRKKKAEANGPDQRTLLSTNTGVKDTQFELLVSREVYAEMDLRSHEALRFVRLARRVAGSGNFSLSVSMIQGAEGSLLALIDALGQMEIPGREAQ
jgi:hypothetical protein